MKIDRKYFEKKKNPNADDEMYTKCCKEYKEGGMFKDNKDDWELIETHIEKHLTDYSNVKNVEPIFCEECGRFLQYLCEIDVNQTQGYREKGN